MVNFYVYVWVNSAKKKFKICNYLFSYNRGSTTKKNFHIFLLSKTLEIKTKIFIHSNYTYYYTRYKAFLIKINKKKRKIIKLRSF